MTITLALQKTLAEKAQDFAADPDFIRLQEFYKEMKRRGLVRKQEYSLPPLDTVGQTLDRTQQAGEGAAQGQAS